MPPRRGPAQPSPGWGNSPAKSASACWAPAARRPTYWSSSAARRGTPGGASP
ncbi:UNVERIFIED_CONTAM: hypothetical protein Sradi_5665600 [Sesamum radiatum]|uniref:Uncharacterized protein n=1 Tax=Sesamum radiatum TaxID=300843 RepID=A0AAW2L1E5_SESRA